MNVFEEEKARVEIAGKALQGMMSTEGFWSTIVVPMVKDHGKLDPVDIISMFAVKIADTMIDCINVYMEEKEGGAR